MNVISVPLNMIDLGERLREIDEDYAQLLAIGFEADGQRQPIEVRTPKKAGGKWRLVSGAHRVRAARIVGLATMFAIELTVSDLEAKLREIDENLVRHELSPLDRATFLALRKEVWEQLYPKTRHGGARESDGSRQLGDLTRRFSLEASDKLRISERAIQRAIALYKNIAPEARKLVAGSWISRNGLQLDRLARLDEALQLEVSRRIAKGEVLDDVQDVDAIVRQITAAPSPTSATSFEKFLTVWRKADRQSRQRIVDHLVADGAFLGSSK